MKRCEKCNAVEPASDEGSSSFELFEYCGNCGKNLCPDCMEHKGCCGSVPALSGMDADGLNEDEEK